MKYEAKRSLIKKVKIYFRKIEIPSCMAVPLCTVHITRTFHLWRVFLVNQAIHRCLSIERRTVSNGA